MATQVDGTTVTDDASVVERLGISPVFVESNEENIKITTQADLKMAAAFYFDQK